MEKREVSSLYKRIKRLLIPYLTFSVLYIPLRLFMSGMANSTYTGYWKILIGDSPNGGVWYLYELFLLLVITFFVIRNIRILNIALVISGILVLAVQLALICVDLSIVRYFCAFYFYFLLRLACANCLEEIQKKFERYERHVKLLTKFVCFIAAFIIYELYSLTLLTPVLAILGVNIVLEISRKICACKWLAYCGQNSMDIYLLHGPLLVILRWILAHFPLPKLVIAGLLFGFGLGLSVLIGKYILHSSPVFEFMFLGIEKSKRSSK